MRAQWLLAGVLLLAATVCLGKETKKEAAKAPELPPARPKVITGYRDGQWGMDMAKAMAKVTARHTRNAQIEMQEQPDYVFQLGLPEDVKRLVPEDGKLPRRAPFRNFEDMLEIEAAECRIVYYFFDDKLYMVWCREPLLRQILQFRDWKAKMLGDFGAFTAEKPDGTLVWDQETAYCTATPTFSSSGSHSDGTFLECYTVLLYNKKTKSAIIQWIKENLKPSEE